MVPQFILISVSIGEVKILNMPQYQANTSFELLSPLGRLVMNLSKSMNRLNPYIFNVNFKSGLLEIGQEINKCNIILRSATKLPARNKIS